jgi:hypothetical protein
MPLSSKSFEFEIKLRKLGTTVINQSDRLFMTKLRGDSSFTETLLLRPSDLFQFKIKLRTD